jgi:hypothetical protein
MEWLRRKTFTDWNYRLNYFHVDIRKPEAIFIFDYVAILASILGCRIVKLEWFLLKFGL